MKFSVIVPVYNVEKYLCECIDSILNQSFHDYEIIMVDDGSTDNSPSICDAYKEKYSNIRVIHKTNQGLSAARNDGVKEAIGDYIVFVDSDDIICRNALWNFDESLKDFSDVLITKMTNSYDMHEINSHNVIFSIPQEKDVEMNKRDLFKNIDFSPASVQYIFKRELMIKNEIWFELGRYHEDLVWTPYLLSFAKTIKYYNKTWYIRRMGREGSITNVFNQKRLIDIIELSTDYYKKNKYQNFNQETYKYFLKWLSSSVMSYFRYYPEVKDKDKVSKLIDDNLQFFSHVKGMKRKILYLLIKLFGSHFILNKIKVRSGE